MENKDIFSVFGNAGDSVISELSRLCEPLDDAADKRIFALIEKKCTIKKTYHEEYEDVVEGVEPYMKRPIKRAIAAAAVLLVVAGGAAGGFALLSQREHIEPTSRVKEEDKIVEFGYCRRSSYEKGMLYNANIANPVEYFLDYETMEKSPLCAMPNCTHTTSSCLAKDMGVNPVIYGDCVYYFKCSYGYEDVPEGHQFYMKSKLIKAKLDTSETETLVEFTDCMPDPENSKFILIGSKLWFVGDDKNYELDDYGRDMHYLPSSDTPGAHFMCCIDLETGKYVNHGEICEEYKTSEFWGQSNFATIKGVYNGKIQISLQYRTTDGRIDLDNREGWEEKQRTEDPDDNAVFATYEYDVKTNECTKTDRKFVVEASGDTFVGFDYQPDNEIDMYVIHNGEERILHSSASPFILGDKLILTGGGDNKWIDLSDWSEHSLPDEIGEFVFSCGQYKDSYIFLNSQYQAFKYTEEELRAL